MSICLILFTQTLNSAVKEIVGHSTYLRIVLATRADEWYLLCNILSCLKDS